MTRDGTNGEGRRTKEIEKGNRHAHNHIKNNVDDNTNGKEGKIFPPPLDPLDPSMACERIRQVGSSSTERHTMHTHILYIIKRFYTIFIEQQKVIQIIEHRQLLCISLVSDAYCVDIVVSGFLSAYICVCVYGNCHE